MLIPAAEDVWRKVLLGQYCRVVEIEPNVKLECPAHMVDERLPLLVHRSGTNYLSPSVTRHLSDQQLVHFQSTYSFFQEPHKIPVDFQDFQEILKFQ
jgi:hypothetical protein